MLGQKALPVDDAISYWKILITTNYALYPKFMQFLTEATNRPRGITRDMWLILPDFLKTVKTLDDYDENGCWPSVIDQFVEYARAL
uniref:Defective in cullin neddylation protein n=1 Tax=Steinernema glaseri TaxID=37863 RepID=A0A1I8A2L9_9BILA